MSDELAFVITIIVIVCIIMFVAQRVPDTIHRTQSEDDLDRQLKERSQGIRARLAARRAQNGEQHG